MPASGSESRGKVVLGDAALDYVEMGTGEPVVLVHGSARDRRTWHHQQEEFAKQFRTISYSRRYHWPNEPIRGAAVYSMQEQVEDLAKMLEVLDCAPAHLVGHSYGGFLSLLLAMERPALVRSLAVSEPPATTLFAPNRPRLHHLVRVLLTRSRTGIDLVRFTAFGIAPATRAFDRGDPATGVRRFGQAVFGRGGTKRVSELGRQQVRDNLSTVQAEFVGPGLLSMDPKKLGALQVPTLLLRGGDSVPIFGHIIDRLDELIPDVEKAVVPGASHMMHEDEPAIYNASVLAFLRKHSGSRGGPA